MSFKKDKQILHVLKRQFKNPEIVNIDGRKFEIIDLIPPKLKTQVPLVLVPGWSANAKVLKKNIIFLASLGRRIVVISIPHGINVLFSKNYPEAEFRKAVALRYLIKHKGFLKVDAISHSEGAIFLTIEVTENPDKFRNLVFVSPAGLIGQDSLGRLIKDFSLHLGSQTLKGLLYQQHRLCKTIRSLYEAIKALINSPQRAYQELRAIVDYPINDLIENLIKQGHGVSIIHGYNDKVFPLERLKKTIDINIFDKFIEVKGCHNEFYLDHKYFTRLIDEALDFMEVKHSE